MPDETKQDPPSSEPPRRMLPVQFPEAPLPAPIKWTAEQEPSYTMQLGATVLSHYVTEMVRTAFGAKKSDGLKAYMKFEPSFEEEKFDEGKKEDGIKYQVLDERIDCEMIVEVDNEVFDLSHLRAESQDLATDMLELGFEVATENAGEKDSSIFNKGSRSIRAIAESFGINVRDLMAAVQEVDAVGIENYQGKVLNRNIGHGKK